MKKLTKEIFIEKAKKVHGDKYDYSKVEYVNSETKVCIICPEHGEFFITPGNFLFGQGCKLCGIEKRSKKRKTPIEKFIKKAKEVHGEKYDYSKVDYINTDTNICIICPNHGEFWQTPYVHLKSKIGCPNCANNIVYTTEKFVKKAKEVHGEKYDYSKVDYINAYTKVCIICPKHGEFYQTPGSHLYGSGCPKCVGKGKTTDDFIAEIKQIHGDKYDYSKIEYNGAFNPIRIICKKHGEFLTVPHNLLNGSGCKKCATEKIHLKQSLSTEKFIENAKKVHGDKYDYSKSVYINAKTPLIITCKKHGDFCVIPNKHTSGNKTGCPKCAESKLETEIRVFCENNNIKYKQQKRFSWLGLQKMDFYLPDYNTAIECQGTYHFEPHYSVKTDDKEMLMENLLSQIERDELKNELVTENNVKLLYYVPQNLLEKTKISKIYKEGLNTFTNINELKNILNN